MESPKNVPGVSLVIDLASSTGGEIPAAVQSLYVLLQRLELPSTWVVNSPLQARTLAESQLASTDFELALAVSARSPQRLRSELANLQTSVLSSAGQEVRVISGDAQALRSRAALLADAGIEAVVADSKQADSAQAPKPMPCGLWKFDPAICIPRQRSRWALLPGRRQSVAQLFSAELGAGPQVVALRPHQLSNREAHVCQTILQELAESSRREQLRVAKVSQLAAELARRHEVKPQRSILRRAA